MTKTILISGGSGLIGQRLTERLLHLGHSVRILSRHQSHDLAGTVYQWDLEKGWIDPSALKDLDIVINLAGAGIADRRWTSRRKEVLRHSRLAGNELLLRELSTHNIKPELYLGASAIGIYGNRGSELLDESSDSGSSADFLVELCEAWERSQSAFGRICKRVVSVRIGLVLSMDGGALPPLYKSIILGIGAILGSGQQYMSWIHINDLVETFIHAIEHKEVEGIVNGTAPQPGTHSSFIRTLVQMKGGLGLTFKIPAVILRAIMGDMSQILLDGARVVSTKMPRTDFTYQYGDLESALQNLISK
ncbi:MAG: TIGR01777 family protein [Saprospiraceae bacterium]|nr:TIGR01777 family protein [Saprospiraceae bacterium]